MTALPRLVAWPDLPPALLVGLLFGAGLWIGVMLGFWIAAKE